MHFLFLAETYHFIHLHGYLNFVVTILSGLLEHFLYLVKALGSLLLAETGHIIDVITRTFINFSLNIYMYVYMYVYIPPNNDSNINTSHTPDPTLDEGKGVVTVKRFLRSQKPSILNCIFTYMYM